MQAIEILIVPYKNIAIDFIIGIPSSKDLVIEVTYNKILNVVDRFTKGVEFILQKDTYTIEDLGNVILDRIIRYYGILKIIISNRDKLFKLNYQIILYTAIGTKRKLLTVYYPEIDG